jgi:RyR domain-containing protein
MLLVWRRRVKRTIFPQPGGPITRSITTSMDYQPAPIDTSKVALSADVVRLTEYLSRNAHEVWARQRMAEGWRWGPKRDDARKEHPSLVPYEQLSETDKDLDRQTAMETLKVITALGYKIEKPQNG